MLPFLGELNMKLRTKISSMRRISAIVPFIFLEIPKRTEQTLETNYFSRIS
jgi:hypothetical protein